MLALVLLSRAQANWPNRDALIATGVRPEKLIAVEKVFVAPLERPNCPSELFPAQRTSLLEETLPRVQVKSEPAATWSGVKDEIDIDWGKLYDVVLPVPSWELEFAPQHFSAAGLSMRQLCEEEVVTEAKLPVQWRQAFAVEL